MAQGPCIRGTWSGCRLLGNECQSAGVLIRVRLTNPGYLYTVCRSRLSLFFDNKYQVWNGRSSGMCLHRMAGGRNDRHS